MKPALLLASLVLMLLTGGGCEAVPAAAAAGTVIGVAGTALSDGSAVYSLGKLDFASSATFDQCRVAVNDTISDLKLHTDKVELLHKRIDEVSIRLTDDRKSKIEIRIDRRTAMLCRFRVDVGLFGSEPTARLVMERIRNHLPKSVSIVSDK